MRNKIVAENFVYYEFRGQVADLGRFPGDHCELCGTAIRYQFFIEDDTHGNTNFVGSECIDKWGIAINIDGYHLSADLLPEWAKLDFIIKAIQKTWATFDGEKYKEYFKKYDGYISLKQYNALVKICNDKKVKRNILLEEKVKCSKKVGYVELVKLT